MGRNIHLSRFLLPVFFLATRKNEGKWQWSFFMFVLDDMAICLSPMCSFCFFLVFTAALRSMDVVGTHGQGPIVHGKQLQTKEKSKRKKLLGTHRSGTDRHGSLLDGFSWSTARLIRTKIFIKGWRFDIFISVTDTHYILFDILLTEILSNPTNKGASG
jgi:hypothetical protein